LFGILSFEGKKEEFAAEASIMMVKHSILAAHLCVNAEYNNEFH